MSNLQIKNFLGMSAEGDTKDKDSRLALEMHNMKCLPGMFLTRDGYLKLTGGPYDGPINLIHSQKLQNQSPTNIIIAGNVLTGDEDWENHGTSAGSSIVGMMSAPQGVFYDTVGQHYYIADTGNNRIIKTKSDGTDWQTYGDNAGDSAITSPTQIQYNTATGNIYVLCGGAVIRTQIDGTGYVSNYASVTAFYFDGTHVFLSYASTKTIVQATYAGATVATLAERNFGAGDFYIDDATGDIYIADTANDRIIKTNWDMSSWTTYGDNGGDSAVTAPQAIWYDATTGYIFTVGGLTKIVRTKIDGTGYLLITIAGASRLYGVCYDNTTGWIYTVDNGQDRVTRCDIDGNNQSSYCSSGSGNNQLFSPEQVDYDPATEYLYICDGDHPARGSHRICRVEFGVAGSWAEFNVSRATDIHYDPASGSIFYLDITNQRVVETDINQSFTTTVAYSNWSDSIYDEGIAFYNSLVYIHGNLAATGNNGFHKLTMDLSTNDLTYGQIFTPGVVFYDGAQYAYFYDSANGQMVKTEMDHTGWTTYGSTGSGQDEFSTTITGIWFDAGTSKLLVNDNGNDRLVLTEFDGSNWSTLTDSGSLLIDNPYGMMSDGTNIYYCNVDDNQIAQCAFNGTSPSQYGHLGSLSFEDDGYLYLPQATYYDNATGMWYIADTANHRIVKTDFDGTWVSFGTLGSGANQFNSPSGIVFDGTNVIVADTGNDRLVKTQMDGTGWVTYGATGAGAGQFSSPMGLDRNGFDIYIADSGNDRIVKTDPVVFGGAGGWTTVGSTGTGNYQFDTPTGVHFHVADSDVYVADSGNDRVAQTDMAGGDWVVYGTSGAGTGQFDSPRDIHYDEDRDIVIITDYGNSRLVQMTMAGGDWSTIGGPGSGDEQFDGPISIFYDSVTGNSHVSDSVNGRVQVYTRFIYHLTSSLKLDAATLLQRAFIVNGLDHNISYGGGTGTNGYTNMGIDPPTDAATFNAEGAGSLIDSGTYKMRYEYWNEIKDQPSSMSPEFEYTLGAGKTSLTVNIPANASVDSQVTHARGYLTANNGSVLRGGVTSETVTYDGSATTITFSAAENERTVAMGELNETTGTSNIDVHKKPPTVKYILAHQDRLFLAGSETFDDGTASVAIGSPTVTISTTIPTGVKNLYFQVVGDNKKYLISSLDSTTQITLAENYTGSTNVAASYDIFGNEDVVRMTYIDKDGISYPESVPDDHFINVQKGEYAISEEMMGFIVAGYNFVVILKRGSCFVLSGTTLSDFQLRTLSLAVGCVSGYTAASNRDGNALWLSDQGLIMSDGVTLFNLSDQMVGNVFTGEGDPPFTVNLAELDRSVGAFDSHTNRYRGWVPLAGETEVYIYIEYDFNKIDGKYAGWSYGTTINANYAGIVMLPDGTRRMAFGCDGGLNGDTGYVYYFDKDATNDGAGTTSTKRGTATSSTNTSLTDSTATFTSDIEGCNITILEGTGAGQVRRISYFNSATTIDVEVAWDTNPDTTSVYAIGAIDAYRSTGWLDFGTTGEKTVKKIKHVFEQAAYNMYCKIYRDYKTTPTTTRTFSLNKAIGYFMFKLGLNRGRHYRFVCGLNDTDRPIVVKQLDIQYLGRGKQEDLE
jgi:hypothetical protein